MSDEAVISLVFGVLMLLTALVSIWQACQRDAMIHQGNCPSPSIFPAISVLSISPPSQDPRPYSHHRRQCMITVLMLISPGFHAT